MGGRCNGGGFVAELWARTYGGGPCHGCALIASGDDGVPFCQAVEGIEEPRECPELQSSLQFEGDLLCGVNAPPRKRLGWRR